MCDSEPVGDAVSLLERPIYTYSQVDRALQLSPGTAKRWLNGYRRRNIGYPPVLRPEPVQTPWVSWGEFVETRLFSGYRHVNEIPAQRLRNVVEVLRAEFDRYYPLAYAQPYLMAEGREVLYQAQLRADLPDEFAVVVRTGQLVLTPWVEQFVESAEFDPADNGAAVSLRADGDFPQIRWDPRRRGGEPTIAGRNIQVATIANLVRGGEQPADIAAWYDLTVEQVEQAVKFDATHPRIA